MSDDLKERIARALLAYEHEAEPWGEPSLEAWYMAAADAVLAVLHDDYEQVGWWDEWGYLWPIQRRPSFPCVPVYVKRDTTADVRETPTEPRLGLATTRELLAELRARGEVSAMGQGEPGAAHLGDTAADLLAIPARCASRLLHGSPCRSRGPGADR